MLACIDISICLLHAWPHRSLSCGLVQPILRQLHSSHYLLDAAPCALAPDILHTPYATCKASAFVLLPSLQMNVWQAIFGFIGNYFWTHYFFNLLGAAYTLPSHKLNGVSQHRGYTEQPAESAQPHFRPAGYAGCCINRRRSCTWQQRSSNPRWL